MIVRTLGSGGEGTVYLVRHRITAVLRAVKIYDAGSMGCSLHELEMMKYLSHPSLPRMIDVEQEESGFCLVMEYIPGRSLLDYANQENVSEQFFFHAAEQLLNALEYLHTGRFPILHLDVKPSNIIVKNDGRLVLLDMGAALPLEGRSVSRCMGTVGYAAPEQYDNHGRLTVCTDIYGFGATMYFLLCGENYRKETQNALRKCCRENWKKSVGVLLLQCLKQSASERPESISRVKEMLKKIKRRRERRKKIRQNLSALLLLWGVLAFALHDAGSRTPGSESRSREYEALMEQADRMGDTQAFQYYEKAALVCPERIDAFRAYLARITADCRFTQEEETMLQRLFGLTASGGNTSLYDELQNQKETFGEFACQLGIAYWYFFQGSGGRSAALFWFRKSQEIAGETGCMEVWGQEAEAYVRIGRYYETLGKQGISGADDFGQADYWEDLERLSSIMAAKNDGEETITAAVENSIIEERLNLLILEASALKEKGIAENELLRSIREMREQGADRLFPGKSQDAEDAVKRAYE